MAVRHVRGLHDGTGLGAHLRSNDQHVPATERRGDQQAAGVPVGERVAARAHARLHRTRLGLLHGPRALPFPRRGGDPLLGQVLGLLLHGRHGQHRHRHTCPRRLHRLRRPLLSLARRLQMRGLRHRYERARKDQARARQRLPGPQSSLTRLRDETGRGLAGFEHLKTNIF